MNLFCRMELHLSHPILLGLHKLSIQNIKWSDVCKKNVFLLSIHWDISFLSYCRNKNFYSRHLISFCTYQSVKFLKCNYLVLWLKKVLCKNFNCSNASKCAVFSLDWKDMRKKRFSCSRFDLLISHHLLFVTNAEDLDSINASSFHYILYWLALCTYDFQNMSPATTKQKDTISMIIITGRHSFIH